MKRLPKEVPKQCLKCGYYDKKYKHFYKCCTSRCPARIREKNGGIKVNKMEFSRKQRGRVTNNKFKVIRIWYTEGKSVQNAIDNTDNRNYDEMVVLIKETTAGEK